MERKVTSQAVKKRGKRGRPEREKDTFEVKAEGEAPTVSTEDLGREAKQIGPNAREKLPVRLYRDQRSLNAWNWQSRLRVENGMRATNAKQRMSNLQGKVYKPWSEG